MALPKSDNCYYCQTEIQLKDSPRNTQNLENGGIPVCDECEGGLNRWGRENALAQQQQHLNWIATLTEKDLETFRNSQKYCIKR